MQLVERVVQMSPISFSRDALLRMAFPEQTIFYNRLTAVVDLRAAPY